MHRQISIFAALTIAILVAAPIAAQPPGQNDDPGRVKFRGASFPVAEEAGEVTIIVKRQRGGDGAVTVDYATTDGSAAAGEDYEEANGTLEWADGDRGDKSFTVPILDDDVAEGQETFGVVLSNPTGGVEIGSPSSAVVRIKPNDQDDGDDDDDDSDGDSDDDDDEGDAGVIKLTALVFPAFESNGEATFTVERADGSDGEVTVDYATIDGSATAGDDYISTEGTLTWGDGEDGEMSVTVPLIDDDESEELETISVILTNATGGASLGVRDVGSIIIVDDDGGEGSCVPDDQTLCLQGGRFQITGSWLDFD
ncbi:MAG: Calx-beta domain-containing protein, partial [Thermoanaerobaculia bacterium]